MTATKPDLRVVEMGGGAIESLCGSTGLTARSGGVMMLAELRADASGAVWLGHERDLCTPGFVSGVARALATAGVKQAGGDGVAALHRRTTALAQAVQSIGRVISDFARDVGEDVSVDPRKMVPRFADTLASISEMVEGVAADVFIVDQGKAARATLAAHGWVVEFGSAWQHASGPCVDVVSGGAYPRGFCRAQAELLSPAVLRAFATLAEETRP
jgi:hypothetical protein